MSWSVSKSRQEIADADAGSIRGYKKRDVDIKVTRAGSDLKECRQERILCAEERCARIEEFRGKCYGEDDSSFCTRSRRVQFAGLVGYPGFQSLPSTLCGILDRPLSGLIPHHLLPLIHSRAARRPCPPPIALFSISYFPLVLYYGTATTTTSFDRIGKRVAF